MSTGPRLHDPMCVALQTAQNVELEERPVLPGAGDSTGSGDSLCGSEGAAQRGPGEAEALLLGPGGGYVSLLQKSDSCPLLDWI